jgi:hypothetical protein
MLEDDYFRQKRADLGLDRGDKLVEIQATLDMWYPGQARAKMLHQGVLRIWTKSASVASELRMKQVELLKLHELSDTRLQISISDV